MLSNFFFLFLSLSSTKVEVVRLLSNFFFFFFDTPYMDDEARTRENRFWLENFSTPTNVFLISFLLFILFIEKIYLRRSSDDNNFSLSSIIFKFFLYFFFFRNFYFQYFQNIEQNKD